MSLRESTPGARALSMLLRDAAITWGYGHVEFRQALLDRTVRSIYQRRSYLLYERDLAETTTIAPPPGVAIRAIAERDWEPLAEALTTRNLRRFRRRVAAGNVALVAWQGERPVGYAWYAAHDATSHTLSGRVPADGVYTFGLWVDPRKRNCGVGAALVSARARHAQMLGFRRTWQLLDRGDPAARRAHSKGRRGGEIRPLAAVSYIHLLRRRRVRYESASEEAAFMP